MKNHLTKTTAFVLCYLLPFLAFSQQINLGTAAKKFVLFTTTGALSNINTPVRSQITGDVGTNSASAVTGFVNVNGVIRPGSDATTMQAQTDLENAIVQINAATSTGSPASTIGAPGVGQTFTAGVYDIAGSTTITGNVFLDGQNDPNAVFIFRIAAALSSTAAAKVRMINGAQACNVFWRVNGAINLATETLMSGNIIAIGGMIDLTVNDTLNGRAFTVVGAITTSGIQAAIPTGCGEPLPTGPAAPAIGTNASCFAIFTSTGDVTNTGTSKVTGDIGTNNGTITNYGAPSEVNGTIRSAPPANPFTASAASDLTTLYNRPVSYTHLTLPTKRIV